MAGIQVTERSQAGSRPRPRDERLHEEIDNVLQDPDSKAYHDLRDRAAYVYVTGTYPTHLRRYFTSLLRAITNYHRQPVSLDRRIGSMKLDDEAVARLELNVHPLVRKVQEYINKGYRIQVSRDLTSRRPFSKVFMFKLTSDGQRVADRVTVQYDGSTKEGWS